LKGLHPSNYSQTPKAFNTKGIETIERTDHVLRHALLDTFSERVCGLLCYLRVAPEECASMTEKLVLVGVLPEIVVIGPDEQVVWLSESGNLKIQFDSNRCPFQSNVFQAPPGRQLQSGPPRPGINQGSYKYRLWLNDQPIGNGEVILREK
jgi:hypothetical protein